MGPSSVYGDAGKVTGFLFNLNGKLLDPKKTQNTSLLPYLYHCHSLSSFKSLVKTYSFTLAPGEHALVPETHFMHIITALNK